MKKSLFFIAFIAQSVVSQSVKGVFPNVKNEEIILSIYEGLTNKELAKTMTDINGSFVINYPKDYVGAALLQIKDNANIILLLNHEDIVIRCSNLKDLSTLELSNTQENDLFAKGIVCNQQVEQKLSGLKYLLPLYEKSPNSKRWLEQEIMMQQQIMKNFIDSLPKDSFVKQYLTIRKFLEDMQLSHERYKEIERIAQHTEDFKKLDFSSDAFWKSGLVGETLNSYYQLLQNYKDAKLVNDHCIVANMTWLTALEKHPIKQGEIAEFCFNLLEKYDITKASEHIALTMLNKPNCQLSEKQKDLFMQYKDLAKGKTAPNIFNVKNGKALRELPNKYKLIVFGASWCPNCESDYPSLVGKYQKWKENYDLEIIYISIDTDITTFNNYYKEAPFITYCDTKGWESQPIKDYHVFATPTYVLVNKELKILEKIKMPEHLDSWLTTFVK